MELLSDDEVFGAGQGASVPPAAVPSTGQQQPAPNVPQTLSEGDVFGSSPMTQTEAAPSTPLSDADVFGGTATNTSRPNAISRGFVSGMLEQNPALASEALEGFANMAPEGFLRDSLASGSKTLRGMTATPEAYRMTGKRFRDIGGIDDALTWAGETFGSGVASTVPSIATGLVGAGVGGAVAGPPGATVGGLAGAGSSSLVFNYGEVYKALKDAGMPAEQAASYALYGAVPMAALDTASVGPIISRLGGISELKRQTARNIAQRIMSEGAKGAGREGITEAAQEAVKQATVASGTDKPFWSLDNTWDIIENGLGGALVGAGIGGGSGIVRDRVASIPASDPNIGKVYAESVATPAQPENLLGTGPVAQQVTTPTTPTPDIAFSQVAEAQPTAGPVFYSAVRKAIEDRLPDVMDASQVLGTLQNTPGIKAEEIDALGLPQYLKGRQRVSKKDLISEVETNAIQIEDVIKRDEPEGMQLNWSQELNEEGGLKLVDEANGFQIKFRNGRFELFRRGVPGSMQEGWIFQESFSDQAQAEQAARVMQGWTQSGGGQTQYADYTLPGGGNYREFLMTMPSQVDTRRDRAHQEYVDAGKRNDLPGMRTALDKLHAANAMENKPYVSPHWSERNVLAHFRTTDRIDAEGKRGTLLEEVQSDWHQKGRREGYQTEERKETLKRAEETASNTRLGLRYLAEAARVSELRDALRTSVPDAPFKTSWAELAFKRFLRDAADRGMERVYLPTGQMQLDRYRGMNEGQQSGQMEFYDKILPRIAEKWARKLGGKTGVTTINSPSELRGARFTYPDGTLATRDISVRYIDITPQMQSNLQRGLPMFSKAIDPTEIIVDPGSLFANDIRPALEQAGKVLKSMAKRMGVDKHLAIISDPTIPELGLARQTPFTDGTQGYLIRINPKFFQNPQEAWSILAHEFGHVLMWEKFDSADMITKASIKLAYENFRRSMPYIERFDDLLAARDNFVSQYYNTRKLMNTHASADPRMQAPEWRQYWLGFDEWFAEQVAMWATTDRKPLTFVEKFFSGLAKALRQAYQSFQKYTGRTVEPEAAVRDWLNSLLHQPEMTYSTVILDLEVSTKRKAEADLNAAGYPHHPAESQTASTSLGRKLVSGLGMSGNGQAKATLAMADRFNQFYNYMLSMVQVADRNPHIAALQRYRELWQIKQLERANIMNQALETVKAWRKLGSQQSDNLAGLIDDYMNLKFLTAAEKAAGVSRRPTQAEFADLVKNNKVSNEGLAVFQRVVSDFDSMLARYKEILTLEAQRISDPIEQARRLSEIDSHIAALAKQPYFPAMRFGNLTLTIRDAAGHVIHFETFENPRARRAAMKDLQAQLKNGEVMQVGVLSEDAAPMIGMPPGILDRMAQTLNLSPSQRQAMELLRYELAPAQSFRHRFQRKNRVEGYSKDFVRAYANYFFHGSNYYTNVKYVQPLRDQVAAVREDARQMVDGTKRGEIANFLSDHLDYTLDPKPDFATLRSMMFHWALGFSPAAAALNLSQTLVGSYPLLGAKFGDLKAIGALGRAGKQLSTYYRRGTLEGMSERDMRALSEGIKEGVLTEAMAPELAAASEGRNLGKGFGGTATEAALQKFSEASSWMFQMSEQWNRRVTFRAAWQLASDNPNATYVKDAVEKHKLQYERLRAQGWTEQDAAAFVTAKDAVEVTQYIYQGYAQPRFMRGKLRTVFIFKTFVQNTLFMLWNYPDAAVRSILVMGMLGGLMGVPGAEDLRAILKAVAYRLFGKSFDLDDEARKLAIDILGGKVKPDLLLHGISRYGMGIPWVADMVGVPLPYLDRSKSIGMGMVSPLDVGALLGPERDQSRAIAEGAQKASGAAFGMGFNMYKALTDGSLDWNDFKRWERAMPRSLASISKSWRAYNEGEERTRTGATVVRYDVNDTRQMMEVLAMAMGYQPLRLSATWDRIIAEREAVMYWDLRRQGLMRQMYQALRAQDRKQVESVQQAIRKFNGDLPTEARGKAITADAIRESIQARVRQNALQEGGLSAQKSNIPILRDVQRLHPEAEVDVRKVR